MGDSSRQLPWEPGFTDVFTNDRTGFGASIGNSPREVIEPNSQEFDPIERTTDKQAALLKQAELFELSSVVDGIWGEYNEV